jgi:NADH-quinone oxidoreductase subunit F
MQLHGKVVVLGGGNVAFDVARTALRTGARDVQIFYRRSVEEMPAWEKDIQEAREEGVLIHPLWAPKEILSREGKVTGITFARSRTVHDPEGRTRLAIDEGDTQSVEADAVIISVGQAPDIGFLSKDGQLERALWGSLVVDGNRLATNVPGIFAGGDFTTGPSTVIQAIAAGRRAALAIHGHFRGQRGRVEMRDEKSSLGVDRPLVLEGDVPEEGRPRARPAIEHPEGRVRDFREVEMGLNEDEARYEARRCLRCDLERDRSMG